MHILAKRQKELRASKLLAAPRPKARILVKEVIVTAGPECPMASWILLYAVYSP